MNPAFSFSLHGKPTQKSAKTGGQAIGWRDLSAEGSGPGTRLIWSSLATSARSLSSFSSTDTAAAAAAIVGVREASKGKDGRRCQTSGGSASEEGCGDCVVCGREQERGFSPFFIAAAGFRQVP